MALSLHTFDNHDKYFYNSYTDVYRNFTRRVNSSVEIFPYSVTSKQNWDIVPISTVPSVKYITPNERKTISQLDLPAVVYHNNGVWRTSDSSIATVDYGSGTIEGISPGLSLVICENIIIIHIKCWRFI